MAQEKKMPPKEMPKEVSIMGGCPVPNLCSPLLYLAELEAEGKAKAPRLRAQQKRPTLAERAKASFEKAVRHLRGRAKKAGGNSERLEVCRPSYRGSSGYMAMGARTHARKPAR